MGTSAAAERAALCDLFDELGPDEPTLCEGWATRDLAAHLVVRERRPDGAVGIVVKPLAGYTDKVMAAEAAAEWTDLVERVRGGPPWWMPTSVEAVDRAFNAVEFFIHHEDVRRAQPAWAPRSLPPDLVADLWTALRRGARLLARRAPAGVTLQPVDAPDNPEPLVAKQGEPMVTVRGPVGELVLFIYGRQQHSEVVIEGPTEAADAIREASFGI